MHCFWNKFSKVAKRWGPHPQHHLTFDIGDLKLRDLAKQWFFKLIVVIELKKPCYYVISMTILKNVTRRASQIFQFGLPASSPPMKLSGNASVFQTFQ